MVAKAALGSFAMPPEKKQSSITHSFISSGFVELDQHFFQITLKANLDLIIFLYMNHRISKNNILGWVNRLCEKDL
jgi:hypothetical protein